MGRALRYAAVLACLAAVGSAASADPKPNPDRKAAPVSMIFDTDMDTDCDDAGALAMLHALADRGEVRILATVVSSFYPSSVPCAAAINRYYGRGDLPIGSPKGKGASTRRGSRYARQIAEEFPTRFRSNEDAPNAADVYRRVLAAEPAGSVTIVTVGYLTNLRDLLETEPDAVSPLDGRRLVELKVARWVCMGGRYPENRSTRVNGNFKPDPESTVAVVRDWPGPIHFTGLGSDILTGSTLKRQPEDNPVRRVYELYLRGREVRPSWDQVAVLFAARPDAPFWTLHREGYNHIREDGRNQWRETPDKDHLLLGIKEAAADIVRDTIESLMTAPPKRKGAGEDGGPRAGGCGTGR